mmetsp:Transcript_74475/g.206850  ORF Transcript_74475/g.206850 Transcript_74475/m.206850 type:complete len:789 (-) Transcript_74475:125-2491(-)
MAGVVELGCAAGLFSYGWWHVTSAKWSKERKKLSMVSQLYREVLKSELNPSRPRASMASPPSGADSSAAAALSAVQHWQVVRAAAKGDPGSSSAPSCHVGIMKVNACGDGPPPTDAESAVCEEFKPWLLVAAGGSVQTEEVARRLELCRQLLMRPESLDGSFVQLMASVSQHLDALSDRHAGAVRTCAIEISRLLARGRQFVDSTMPVFLFGLPDAFSSEPPPHLTAELLAASAGTLGDRPSSPGSDPFANFWRTPIGGFLQEVFSTAHFLELWEPLGASASSENSGARRRRMEANRKKDHNYVEEKWLALTTSVPLQSGSGICDLFWNAKNSDLQLVYFDLFKQMDNFILFLSSFMVYKRMANIAGDAAMSKLRTGLHHLLRELEHSLMQVRQGAARVADEAKHTAAELAMSAATPSGRRLDWIERMQHIDEITIDKAFQGAMESIQELRFLSSEARQPALHRACKRSLVQLADITESSAFRARCQHALPAMAEPDLTAVDDEPEEGVLLALPAPPAGEAIEAVPSEGAVWSVERQFVADDADVVGRPELIDPKALSGGSRGFAIVGEAVSKLNAGVIECPNDFCIVGVPEVDGGGSGEGSTAEEEIVALIVLYKRGARNAAMSSLGLTDAAEVAEEAIVDTPEEPQEDLPCGQDLDFPEPRSVPLAEEDTFYEVLLMSVSPFFGGGDVDILTRGQAVVLLERTGLGGADVQTVLDQGLASMRKGKRDMVDCPALKRIGREVATLQAIAHHAGSPASAPTHGENTALLPELRGISWDGRRIRVLETF